MSYRNGKLFLESKTHVIELINEFGARVAVCPDWNGRVMTSSCDGIDGDSFGLIRVKEIETIDPHSSYLAYGGEVQFSLSPRNGPCGLHGTAHGYCEGPFEIDSAPTEPILRMRRVLHIRNQIGMHFDLNIRRTVKLLNAGDVQDIFGHDIEDAISQENVSYVAYEAGSTVINVGQPLHRDKGLFSIRARSMFNAGPNVIVIIPFRRLVDEFGGGEHSDLELYYYGRSPRGMLRQLNGNILLHADGRRHCAVLVPKTQAQPVYGSIDYRAGVLTIVRFNLPNEPERFEYLSDRPTKQSQETTPCTESVLHVYNSGDAPDTGQLTSPYYAFDAFSPTAELAHGESLSHVQATVHVSADSKTLDYLIQKIFAANYEQVYNSMLRQE